MSEEMISERRGFALRVNARPVKRWAVVGLCGSIGDPLGAVKRRWLRAVGNGAAARSTASLVEQLPSTIHRQRPAPCEMRSKSSHFGTVILSSPY
jgi:hypothetical protein